VYINLSETWLEASIAAMNPIEDAARALRGIHGDKPDDMSAGLRGRTNADRVAHTMPLRLKQVGR
jgi:hypothetical protein